MSEPTIIILTGLLLVTVFALAWRQINARLSGIEDRLYNLEVDRALRLASGDTRDTRGRVMGMTDSVYGSSTWYEPPSGLVTLGTTTILGSPPEGGYTGPVASTGGAIGPNTRAR